LEQDKEEDGFAHPVGKRPRKEPLFGGALQKMETGSDFAIGLTIWLNISSMSIKPSEFVRQGAV
jgi:hypothetical protein